MEVLQLFSVPLKVGGMWRAQYVIWYLAYRKPSLICKKTREIISTQWPSGHRYCTWFFILSVL